MNQAVSLPVNRHSEDCTKWKVFVLFLVFFNVCLFLRESASESRGGAERRKTQKLKQAPAVGTEPNAGLELTNRKIMT